MVTHFQLSKAKSGQKLVIDRCDNPETEMQLVRMGISYGQVVFLAGVVPGGPFVLRLGETEIALGRDIAASIWVQLHIDVK
jgi:Fe2+ transport system protein FeoA